jgi:hypothetical protein
LRQSKGAKKRAQPKMNNANAIKILGKITHKR